MQDLGKISRPVALLRGGEATVRVRGKGHGGRNQEAALAASLVVDGAPSLAMLFLATDGIDGVAPPGAPPAAGAIITGATAELARKFHADPCGHLQRSDSYAVFNAIDRALGQPTGAGSQLTIGPTGTNVCDLAVALVYPL